MRVLVLSVLLVLAFSLGSAKCAAQTTDIEAVPCISLTEKVCANLLYKRAPVSVPALQVQQGKMMCICMADFHELRIPADEGQAKINQQVAAKMAAEKLNISPQDLLRLIRN